VRHGDRLPARIVEALGGDVRGRVALVETPAGRQRLAGAGVALRGSVDTCARAAAIGTPDTSVPATSSRMKRSVIMIVSPVRSAITSKYRPYQ
jgi:hypothetical protein